MFGTFACQEQQRFATLLANADSLNTQNLGFGQAVFPFDAVGNLRKHSTPSNCLEESMLSQSMCLFIVCGVGAEKQKLEIR